MTAAMRHRMDLRWTRARIFLVVAATVVTSSGCYTGPHALEFSPARSGHGVAGELVLQNQSVRGELLASSDTAFVMESASRILLIPRSAVYETRFEGLRDHRGADLSGDVLEKYRLMSRFPAGISAGMLRMLLAQTGQSELTVVRD